MINAFYEVEHAVMSDVKNGRGPIHPENGWYWSGVRLLWIFEQDEEGLSLFGYNDPSYHGMLKIARAWGYDGTSLLLREQTHTSMGRIQELAVGWPKMIGLERIKAVLF